MVFLITGLVIGLHFVGVDFDRNALLVAYTIVLYGEAIVYRLNKQGKP
jgi:hypothetical protein